MAASATASTKGKAPAIVDDDEDLDDLDDVIDQFQAGPEAGKSSSNNEAASHERINRGQESNDDADGDESDDEDFEAVFAAELAKEMEKMMAGLKPSADDVAGSKIITPDSNDNKGKRKAGGAADDASNARTDESDEEKQLREAFEKMLANADESGENGLGNDLSLEQLTKLMSGFGAAPNSGTTAKKPGAATSGKGTAPTFQETIAATMSKLAESDAQEKAQSGAASTKDPLAALMAQMEALGGPGAAGLGTGDDEDLPELLDGLMDQLMSKEMLYEPITELRTKYPEFLSSSEAASLPLTERSRYEKQGAIVRKIATIFEDPKYSDTDKDTREKIANLMQQMQECGAPPKHLLGELGPMMGLNADGTTSLDAENCLIS